MSSTPGDSLRSLFDAALERAPADRTGYLQAHCADPELRARVLALLAAHASTVDPLSNDWAGRIAQDLGHDTTAAGDDDVLPPGGRIGSFRVLRVIGQGGFSTVFEGEREVAGVVQRVAVKVLHYGLHTADARRRFEHERRALLQLRHPNITRMIDAGVTDAGQPWIALDLVEGLPITKHARRQHLDLAQRLALFTGVCQAVVAAHRALIVHRDIKPGNVLVSTDGTVSLLDFGIAKLLDDPHQDRTVAPAFTPAYAAPEQQSGGQITTATDVYALGILLDELITGERRAPGETRRPSLRVGSTTDPDALPSPPAAMRRLLRGDLDNIVLKAIDPEPERRYGSASALCEDIERHLSHRPVLAHPPSKWYRSRKFVARHRGGVATTAAFLLAILAALGLALWNGHRAEVNAQHAAAVQAFLVDLFRANALSQPDPAAARQTTARELLDLGAQRIGPAMDEAPAVKLELLETLGALYFDLGLFEQAAELRTQAVALAPRVHGRDDPRTAVALYELASALQSMTRFDEAAEKLAEAGAILDRNGDHGSLQRGTWLVKMSTQYQDTDVPRAIEYARGAAAIFERLGARAQLAETLSTLGWLQDNDGQHEQAAATLTRAIALTRELPDARYNLPRLHAYLADAQLRAMRLEDAETNARQALADVLRLNGDEPADTVWFQIRLGRLLMESGRPREAIDLLAQATELAGRVDEYQVMWARAAHAQALVAGGMAGPGAEELDGAIATCQRLQPDALFLARWLDVLASARIQTGRFDAAAAALAQARKGYRTHERSPDSLDMIDHLATQAELALAQGRPDDARAALDQARPDAAAGLSFERLHLDLVHARTLLAEGDAAGASAQATRVRAAIESARLDDYLTVQLAEVALLQGRAALQSGNAAKALAPLARALALRKAAFLPGTPPIAEAERALAMAQQADRQGNRP